MFQFHVGSDPLGFVVNSAPAPIPLSEVDILAIKGLESI